MRGVGLVHNRIIYRQLNALWLVRGQKLSIFYMAAKNRSQRQQISKTRN